jgi:hypothetical protein
VGIVAKKVNDIVNNPYIAKPDEAIQELDSKVRQAVEYYL